MKKLLVQQVQDQIQMKIATASRRKGPNRNERSGKRRNDHAEMKMMIVRDDVGLVAEATSADGNTVGEIDPEVIAEAVVKVHTDESTTTIVDVTTEIHETGVTRTADEIIGSKEEGMMSGVQESTKAMMIEIPDVLVDGVILMMTIPKEVVTVIKPRLGNDMTGVKMVARVIGTNMISIITAVVVPEVREKNK